MRYSFITILLLLLTASAHAQSGSQIKQSVVAGGGGASAAGPFKVEGTAGQSVTGVSGGGPFQLESGFWPGAAAQAISSLSVDNLTAVYGATVELKATLTATGANVSGILVTFSLNGTNVGTATTGADGQATLHNVSLSGIDSGIYATGISAEITSDAQLTAGSGAGQLTITKADPLLSITGGSFTYDGQPHPATASATGVNNEVLGPVSVFYNGSIDVPVGAGSYAVSATFAGNQNYNPATNNQQSIVIAKATTMTDVSSSVNPSGNGQDVTFTATVTSTPGTPSGSVQFKDGGNDLGSPVPLNGSGIATLTTSLLTVGTHTITADYLGDNNFDLSTGTLAGGQAIVDLTGWTTTGANGATEDESNPARPTYANFTVGLSDTSPAGTYILRYNIMAIGNLTSVGSANTRLRVRFRDEGAGSRVTVAIRSSPITGGSTTLSPVFDSDAFSPDGGFQTQELLMPALVFDFTQNTYWLEVSLTKTDTSNKPGLGSVQINQQ